MFPLRNDIMTLPLYAVEWTRPFLTDSLLDTRSDSYSLSFGSMTKAQFGRLIDESTSGAFRSSDGFPGHVKDRRTLVVDEGRRMCLCTFFNAFPAGYWRHWTNVRRIRFCAEVAGAGTLSLFRSTGRGLSSHIADIDVSAEDECGADEFHKVQAVIPLEGNVDGGYVWVDATASDDADLTLRNADWSVPAADRTANEETLTSIAITTYNRASYCLRQLRDIAADDALRRRLDVVYCIDQGTDRVEDQEGFRSVSEQLGTQLQYSHQVNLGGSGGFSRGMYETLRKERSSYVILLDDDAVMEPESLLRALQFADYCRRPTIVGGGMFHLDDPTVLYTQGERLNLNRMWMESSLGLPYNHDFARRPLRDTPERHQRIDSDFNGWWTCLIPVAVIRDVGLSLPVFIKFDDTEYCLRAKEHGYPTVCLPGLAVWHQAWHAKDPGRTWEEYFFQRNRWICALLHSPRPRRRFAIEMLYSDVLAGMRLTYSSMRLHHMGLEDIMRGPGYIVDSLPEKLDEIKRERSRFADAQTVDETQIPEVERELQSSIVPGTISSVRRGLVKAAFRTLLSHRSGVHDQHPETAITAREATWQSFLSVDSALVSSPDGNSVAWFRRNDRLFRHAIFKDLRLIARLMRNWKRLSLEYRRFDMSSASLWGRIFSSGEKMGGKDSDDSASQTSQLFRRIPQE